MLTGKLLALDVYVKTEVITLTAPDAPEGGLKMMGMVMVFPSEGKPLLELTCPLPGPGAIKLCCDMANLMTAAERGELMAKLAVKGVLLAEPGDELKAARAARAAQGPKP